VLVLLATPAQAGDEYEIWPGPSGYPPDGLDSVRMSISLHVTLDPDMSEQYAVFSFKNVSTDPTARIHRIGLEGGRYLDEIDHIDNWGQANFDDKNSAIGGYTYDFGMTSKTGTEGSTLLRAREGAAPSGGGLRKYRDGQQAGHRW